jgi:hypothetical protein
MEQLDPIEALKLIRGLAFAASGSHEVGYLKTTVRDVLVIVHKALPPRTARPNKILPVSGWLFPTHSPTILGRGCGVHAGLRSTFSHRDMRHVQEHLLGAVHVKHHAAGALPETTAGLAGFPFVRWEFLAGIPQGIFPRGPISLMTPRLEIG